MATAKLAEERKAMMEEQAKREERLIRIIEADHRVIVENSKIQAQLLEFLKGMQGTIVGLQGTVRHLEEQVTTDIAQNTNGVPLKVFWSVVLFLLALLAAIAGLDIAGLHIGNVPTP